MRTPRLVIDTQEPIGIVIADGGRGEALPRFSALGWGPVAAEADVVRGEVREPVAGV